MWAIPRRYDGPSASAHRAASTGVSSPTSCRSASRPSTRPWPVTVSPASPRSTVQPIRREQVAQDVAGLGRRPRPVAHGDAPAGRRGQRQERRGVGQVGLDQVVDGATPCRVRPASGWARCRRPRRRARAASRRSCRGGAATGPACRRGARRRRRRSGPRPAAAPRRTGWTPTRPARPARRAPVPTPATVNGRRSPLDADAERAQGGEDLADRSAAHVGVAVEGDVAVGQPGHGRHEPRDGAGQAAVDVDPSGQRGRRDAASRRRRCRCGSRARPAHPPSARCRASAGHGVRRWVRRPGRPGPARGWSATCSRAGTPPRARVRVRTGLATVRWSPAQRSEGVP